MPKALTADDLVPLIACLTPSERARLLKLIRVLKDSDAAAYHAQPSTADEFGSDEEPLAWEAEGWEAFT